MLFSISNNHGHFVPAGYHVSTLKYRTHTPNIKIFLTNTMMHDNKHKVC